MILFDRSQMFIWVLVLTTCGFWSCADTSDDSSHTTSDAATTAPDSVTADLIISDTVSHGKDSHGPDTIPDILSIDADQPVDTAHDAATPDCIGAECHDIVDTHIDTYVNDHINNPPDGVSDDTDTVFESDAPDTVNISDTVPPPDSVSSVDISDTTGTGDTSKPADTTVADTSTIADTTVDDGTPTLPDVVDTQPSVDIITPVPDTTSPDDTTIIVVVPDTSAPVDIADPPPSLEISAVWPRALPRDSMITLTLQGSAASEIVSVTLLDGTQPDPKVFIFANEGTYLSDQDVWTVPVSIPPNVAPGPRTLVVQWPTGSVTWPMEIDLAPGEMVAAVGTGDIGKTLGTLPMSDMELFFPVGLGFGEGILYFTDAGWNTIHALNLSGSTKTLANGKFVIPPFYIALIAGTAIAGPSIDGDSLLIPLSEPKGLCYLTETEMGGPLLFFADTTHHQIRVLNLGDTPAVEMGIVIDPGFVATLAGKPEFGYSGDGGPALDAKFFRPWRVRGCEGKILVTGDVENYRVRAINRSDSPVTVGNVTIAPGHVDTIAGSGVLGFSGDQGPATAAKVSIPKGFAFSKSGILAFSDPENDRVRAVNTTSQPLTFAGKTIAPGNVDTIGPPGALIDFQTVVPGYNHPTGLRLDEYENLYVADTYSQTLKLHNFTTTPIYRADQWVWPGPVPVTLAGIEHYKGDYEGIGDALSLVMADPFTVEYVPERGELFAADVENHVVLRLKLYTPYTVWTGDLGPFPALPPSNPSTPHLFNTDTGVLSVAGGKAHYFGGGSGVFNFTDISIPSGVHIKITGQRPCVWLATGPVIIQGTVVVESGSLQSGPGVGIGSGGGGHATTGTGVGAGAAYGNPTLVPLSGGSAGGSGGAGGGGLVVATLDDVWIEGTVTANGKTGGKPGAGSGGAIRVTAWGALSITGTLSATGGQGQGAGAAGRIRLESGTSQMLTGTIKPTPSVHVFSPQSPPIIPGI